MGTLASARAARSRSRAAGATVCRTARPSTAAAPAPPRRFRPPGGVSRRHRTSRQDTAPLPARPWPSVESRRCPRPRDRPGRRPLRVRAHWDSTKPRTRERLATDGRDGSGYSDRPPGYCRKAPWRRPTRTARRHDPAGFRQHSSSGREGLWRTGDVARPTPVPPNPAVTQVNRPQDRRCAGIGKTVTSHTAARRHRQFGRGRPAYAGRMRCPAGIFVRRRADWRPTSAVRRGLLPRGVPDDRGPWQAHGRAPELIGGSEHEYARLRRRCCGQG